LSNGSASGTYTDSGAAGSDYTYVVYMRDRAFNYSAGTAVYCNNCTSFCTGTPAPGNTLVDDATPCIGDNITLSLQNATPGNGVTYQWQRATNAAFTTGLTDLGTSSTQVTASVTGTVYYRCQVTCSATSSSGTTTAVSVTGQTCYCASGATETIDGRIQRVRFNTIDQTSPNTCQTYTDYTAVSTTVVPGSVYNLIINQGTCGANTGHKVRAWIDFNGDGIFSDPAERVFDANMGSLDPTEVSQAVTIPYTAVGGPTGMRVVSRVGTSSNPQPCGTYSRGETEDYTINICDMVWNGGTTAWGTASNWSCGVLPTAVNNVTIPASPSGGNQPIVNLTSAVARNVSVQAGATVTISSGNALTVHGDLTNNGTVNVQNNGSLVQVEGSGYSGSGTCNVIRTGSNVYDYWSSPTVAAPVSMLGGTVYRYNPATGTADPADDNTSGGDPGWEAASGAMSAGRGYAAYGSGTRTFTGAVNNGDVQATIQYFEPEPEPYSGNLVAGVPFNLVGNPYPSGIDITQFLAANNSAVLEDGTVYLWDDPGTGIYASGDYAQMNNATFIAGGGGTASTYPTIGSHQGFKVRAANGATQLNFTNAMRSAANTSVLFRQLERKLIWISAVSSGNHYNQTAVGFFEDGTDLPDWGYDAPKFSWKNRLSLYSILQGRAYGIQIYGEFEQDREVPLGVHCGVAQSVTFRLDSVSQMDSEDIYLEDRLLGNFHDLRQSDYIIPLAQGTHDDRFFLRFGGELITSIAETSALEAKIYMADGTLFLFTTAAFNGTVHVQDVSGRIVWQSPALHIDSNGRVFDMHQLNKGVYVVTIDGIAGRFNAKVVR
jgi:trimeric autotransporter adhesin